MEIKKIFSENALEYYKWIKKNDNINIPYMSVFGFEALSVNDIGDLEVYFTEVSNVLEVVMQSEILKSSNIYLFVNIINRHENKVENYMKVWKRLKKIYNLSNFVLGEEVFYGNNIETFYAGVAQVPIGGLKEAFRIIHYNPDRCSLFISESEDYLLKGKIMELLPCIMRYNGTWKIDYSNYFIKLCDDNAIPMRYGYDCLSSEITMVFKKNKELSKMLNDVNIT